MLPLIILMFIATAGHANDKTGETVEWQVISSGGVILGTSGDYQLSGTASQTAIGAGTSENYIVSQGFWPEVPISSGDCCNLPGDANDNGSVNILDITYLISFLYKSGPAPQCLNEADPNNSCNINILDITFLISFLYKSGPAPVCGCTE